MRKSLVSILIFGLVAGMLAAPAFAGRKTIKKSYTFTAPVSNPTTTDVDPWGCAGEASVEDASKDTYTFKAPRHRRKGRLSVRISGFIADWDLYVFNKAETTVLGSSTTDNLSQDYEAVTVSIKGGTTVKIVACNWSSPSPQANGSILYKYRG